MGLAEGLEPGAGQEVAGGYFVGWDGLVEEAVNVAEVAIVGGLVAAEPFLRVICPGPAEGGDEAEEGAEIVVAVEFA